mmetsp:Transcript_17735/g.41708  ORF Transcript_17735/g.41708 Transcript_17735/m.41708 type:complete len:208 (-) Transcript_17735:284-907(-)
MTGAADPDDAGQRVVQVAKDVLEHIQRVGFHIRQESAVSNIADVHGFALRVLQATRNGLGRTFGERRRRERVEPELGVQVAGHRSPGTEAVDTPRLASRTFQCHLRRRAVSFKQEVALNNGLDFLVRPHLGTCFRTAEEQGVRGGDVIQAQLQLSSTHARKHFCGPERLDVLAHDLVGSVLKVYRVDSESFEEPADFFGNTRIRDVS